MYLKKLIGYRKLSDVAHRHDNYFNLLRFFAAVSVIYIHAFPIYGAVLPYWHFARPVEVFFIISGFLVTKSLTTRQDLYFFVRSRVLRIWPALFVVLALTAFVLGPIVSTYSWFEYMTNIETYTYIITNTLLIPPLQQGLPGVFAGNPAYGINGSLWTIPYEVQLYTALIAIAAVSYRYKGAMQKKMLFRLVCAACCAGFAYFLFDILLAHQTIYSSNRFAFHFFAGSLLWLAQSRIILSKYIMLLCIIALYALSGQPLLYNICFNAVLAYFVLYIAYFPSNIAKKLNALGDYSYGMYIYAFPIQQTLVVYVPNVSVYIHCIIAIMLSIVCGYFSWHYIEKPALQLR